MILEIWYYKATLPNDTGYKARPVLVIGNDSENNLSIVDIHYCMVSSSSSVGKYDVEISEKQAKELGLTRASVIKTTKLYTGSQRLLERKVCDLPDDLKAIFSKNYKAYQNTIFANFD
ncbi:MAG: type II toxin-antitoxin system PemK/MazF family toxin [Defluviitaleaceae bacterium]|nr:type II toxin-antitoxin system PemK/MazF family toxin [Defluviitaleaceae bacterium]